MLLDEDEQIEGTQVAVLVEVYATVLVLLEENGHTHEDADRIALQLLPRLQYRLASAGLVVRQIRDDGRHVRSA